MVLALVTVACHAIAGPGECCNSLMEFILATQSDLLVEEQLVGLLTQSIDSQMVFKGLQFYNIYIYKNLGFISPTDKQQEFKTKYI